MNDKPTVIHPDLHPHKFFTVAQIDQLRHKMGQLEKVDPCSDSWAGLCAFVETLEPHLRRQLAGSGIKWLSYIAKRSLPKEPRLVPACGGTETPVTVNGRKYLWCYDVNRTGTYPDHHVYVDLATDLPISPEEHDAIFNHQYQPKTEEI